MDYASLIDDIREEQADIKATFINEQMERIRNAKNRNVRCTLWVGYRSEYQAVEYEVRKLFESKGYKVKPTGYEGGVWQDSEDIYW